MKTQVIYQPILGGKLKRIVLRSKIAPYSPSIPGQAPEKLSNPTAIKERNHTRNTKHKIQKKAGVRLHKTRCSIHKWRNRHNRIAFRGVKIFGRR